ncbi:DUF4268 domain-containing protein [Pelolinea submarina]|uniref:Uncharacterized protein DUF4268 n=1 Tax=Pelolinea submarina TaxID=913107 RepID=A0A347ZV93_9CHLR|nr:DUF4268 domain-containing protein [Pelolinea submarina]REG10190.1 uncharacterized protein DUF4268 [Pelolinea submarina]BBB49224.1 hypothetical protein Pelsub_P2455 [Pelolinea submarina]
MATWVEDIIQALENLGGQAHRKEILEEIRRIRQEPLPKNAIESMQERIQAYSSDSAHFQGIDLFKKMGNGVWALREHKYLISETYSTPSIIEINSSNEVKTPWLTDIIQALRNLGGVASASDICEEVKRIRREPFPTNWKNIIRHRLGDFSSDSNYFKGKDYFRKLENGNWALRNQNTYFRPTHNSTNRLEEKSMSNKFNESPDDIENILKTIKQYRDFQQPNSSSWKDYVTEIFHILGFSTTEKNPRLITLNIMGANHLPKAIVGYIQPEESFDEIVPGLPWDSYIFFAAYFYQITWGILTDGLKLRIVTFENQEIKQVNFWPDFDEIINNEKLDGFFSIQQIFANIKTSSENKNNGVRNNRNMQEKAGKGKSTERQVQNYKFWQQLLGKAKERTNLHANITPNKQSWISTGAGKSGLNLSYYVRENDAQVELYIDNGDKKWNKEIFNIFYKNRETIDKDFGNPLDWQLLPEKRSSRIRFLITTYGITSLGHWDALQDQMIDSMINLEKVFRPYIRNL